MDNITAVNYLQNLLGKTLRIQISDGRMFVGQMKCTDKERNVILCNAHEYRHTITEPSSLSHDQSASEITSRYIGLIVVPGEYMTKIELEEFDRNLIV